MPIWNPWHGCRKISPGCQHCYVYRRDASVGRDASVVAKTGDFDLPKPAILTCPSGGTGTGIISSSPARAPSSPV